MSKPKPETTLFALFKDGKRVSKWHTTIETAKTEAFEQKAIIQWSRDFGCMNSALTFADGYEIKEVPHVEA